MTARVAVLSSTEFGRRCVEEGVAGVAECSLAGILTTGPDIPISYSTTPITIATHAKFDEVGRRVGCPVVTLPGRATSAAYLNILRPWRPDLLLVLGWYYLVPKTVRALAPLGCLGIHSSLLPKYRGGAPISWAIINGETVTGVTLFHLDDEVDAGDIVAQRPVPIGALDTCAEVLARATDASIEMLVETLPLIAKGMAPRLSQDVQLATLMPQRKPEDGLIDWSRGVATVHNFIRAQTRPYPGAFTWAAGTRLTIWKAAPAGQRASGAPGTVSVAADGDALLVSCGDGAIRVIEIGLPDGRTVSGPELATTFVIPERTTWGVCA